MNECGTNDYKKLLQCLSWKFCLNQNQRILHKPTVWTSYCISNNVFSNLERECPVNSYSSLFISYILRGLVSFITPSTYPAQKNTLSYLEMNRSMLTLVGFETVTTYIM